MADAIPNITPNNVTYVLINPFIIVVISWVIILLHDFRYKDKETN